MEEGLYPYTKRYLGAFGNHFSTIGIVGMNEAILNADWLSTDITTEDGRKFAKEVLNHMRNRLSDYQEQYGDLYNLEATPAESTTYRFAKHDTEEYPDIVTAGMEGQAPYYTNSTHLPVGYTEDIFEALEKEDELQTLYTSGTVFHAFLGERLKDWKSAANLVKKIAQNFKLPYYTLSPTYSVCHEHGYLNGEHKKCPFCGKETEVYSRITGYYRPVKNWNDGKAAEYKNRRTYEVESEKKEGSERTYRDTVGEALKENVSRNFVRVKPVVIRPEDLREPEIALKKESHSDRMILLSTKTCPNCNTAKRMLEGAGMQFDVMYAEDPEGAALAKELHVSQAPTLLIPHGKSYETIPNVSNIKGFVDRF
jgi:ribonucleoside-triphosphate reductase